jgi:uncharacterized protein YegL
MAQRPLDEVVEFAENPELRCPCVLLLDVSGSMAGKPINELNEGIQLFWQEVSKDPLASKRVEVAVVAFSSDVEVVQDFATIENSQPPVLEAGGATAMGSGILTALDMLRNRKEVYRRNGISYYRPWIFLITDGAPTEPIEVMQRAAQAIQQEEAKKGVAFFAVGVEGADMDMLATLSKERQPLKLKGLAFRELFLWLSASMQRVSSSKVGDKVDLPSPSRVGTSVSKSHR